MIRPVYTSTHIQLTTVLGAVKFMGPCTCLTSVAHYLGLRHDEHEVLREALLAIESKGYVRLRANTVTLL